MWIILVVGGGILWLLMRRRKTSTSSVESRVDSLRPGIDPLCPVHRYLELLEMTLPQLRSYLVEVYEYCQLGGDIFTTVVNVAKDSTEIVYADHHEYFRRLHEDALWSCLWQSVSEEDKAIAGRSRERQANILRGYPEEWLFAGAFRFLDDTIAREEGREFVGPPTF